MKINTDLKKVSRIMKVLIRSNKTYTNKIKILLK